MKTPLKKVPGIIDRDIIRFFIMISLLCEAGSKKISTLNWIAFAYIFIDLMITSIQKYRENNKDV
jgi:hypothetical protein